MHQDGRDGVTGPLFLDRERRAPACVFAKRAFLCICTELEVTAANENSAFLLVLVQTRCNGGIAAKCAGVLGAANLEGLLSPPNAPGHTTGRTRDEGPKETRKSEAACVHSWLRRAVRLKCEVAHAHRHKHKKKRQFPRACFRRS